MLEHGRWYRCPDGTAIRAQRADRWCVELATLADIAWHAEPDLYTSGDMVMSAGDYTGWTVADLVPIPPGAGVLR